jgi:hypothetical protein
MPVKVTTSPGKLTWIRPTEGWKTTPMHLGRPEEFHVDENFYVVGKDFLKPATDSTTARRGR